MVPVRRPAATRRTLSGASGGGASFLSRRPGTRRRGARGQAMIETLFVVLILCLAFFGLLQVAMVFQADEVLHHSAARANRARSVGFNGWMVRKAQRVAAIPNSGKMLEPVLGTPVPFLDPAKSPGENWDRAVSSAAGVPRSARAATELARIPEYLASDNYMRADELLNYEEWEKNAFGVSVSHSDPTLAALGGAGTVRTDVSQRFPLWMPFHRLFYRPPEDDEGVDRMLIGGRAEGIDHAGLYLE